MTTEKKAKKFDKEMVENEFDNFCEAWDIDNEIDEMDEDDRNDFNNFKRKITRVMRNGRLVYNADGTFKLSLMYPVGQGEEGKDLEIVRPKGDNYLDMDRYKEKQSMHKKNAVLAGMTKMPTKFISNLDGVDIKILDAILNLFLAS